MEIINQKLINTINKITIEKEYYLDKLLNSKLIKPEIKFEKTLLDNSTICKLLQISTEMLYFREIFTKKEYIDKFIDLFDIQEENWITIEHNFNASIFQYLHDSGNKILFETYLMNLTNVFDIIDTNLEDTNLEKLVSKYIFETTGCTISNEQVSDIINHF